MAGRISTEWTTTFYGSSREAVAKLVDALRVKFNSTVRYKGKFYSWDTLSGLKAQGLANYVLRRRSNLNSDKPKPGVERADSEAVRDLILSLTSSQAKALGIERNSLWYLQRRARTSAPLKIYPKVRSRLHRQ